MSVSKHTPTLYGLFGAERRLLRVAGDIAVLRATHAATPDEPHTIERMDAEFLLRAVNSHERLVQDLETCLHFLDCALSSDWDTRNNESEEDAVRFYDDAMTRLPARPAAREEAAL